MNLIDDSFILKCQAGLPIFYDDICALYPETTEAGWAETAAEGAELAFHNGCCSLSGTAATTFALYGADGRLWSQQTTPVGSEARFRLPALPGGIYVVEARRDTKVWRQRIALR